MSVSKKVGNAVTRNTVRRRLREVFHAISPELIGHRDVVVSARPKAAEATHKEFEEEFGRALDKLSSIRSSKKA